MSIPQPSVRADGGMNAPPNPMQQLMKQIKPQPLFYAVGSLFIPLILSIITAFFLFHSSLCVSIAEVIYCWFSYLAYQLYHRRGSLHSKFASNETITGYYLPLLMALITIRFLITHTLSKKLPHTSEKKKRAVLFLNINYALLVWLGFRDIDAYCHEEMAKDITGSTHTPAALFVSIYNATFWFSLLSLVSPFWTPTSDDHLRKAEHELLKSHSQDGQSLQQVMKPHYRAHLSYVVLQSAHDVADSGSNQPDENEGHTELSNPSPTPGASRPASAAAASSSSIPLVFLHGYGAGKSFWFLNLPSLSSTLPNRQIYALDLLGFGMSNHQMRMDNCKTFEQAESYFVNSLENWRREMKINKMILVGHSFGGLVSAAYALRFPQNLAHLILVSPVGLPEQPQPNPGEAPKKLPGPAWAHRFKLIPLLRWLWSQHITLSMALHLLGPLGPLLFRKIVAGRFAHLVQRVGAINPRTGKPSTKVSLNLPLFVNYIYHLNAGACPGHAGLSLLLKPGAYAVSPLLPRLKEKLRNHISLIYGATDWMDATSGHDLCEALTQKYPDLFAECLIVPEAGHQLYLENAPEFNDAVTHIVKESEKRAPFKFIEPKDEKAKDSSASSAAASKNESLHKRKPNTTKSS